MTATPAYTVHEADLARDRETILGIWRGNLGDDARMTRKYDWFYRQCPYGEPLTLLLRHEAGGEFVGVASAGPRRMQWQGREITAGVLVDLAVAPQHRSLGPALSLQVALMDAAGKRFDLLYGFPNPKATPVFKRVGYAALGELSRHARVLRHGAYVRRRAPALIAAPAGLLLDLADRIRLRLRGVLPHAWRDQLDASDADAIWRESNPGGGPVAIRDSTFLQWRFDQSPLVDVRYLLVRDKPGRAAAWFACETREHGLHVHDAWSRDGHAGPSPSQLATLLHAARAQGHASVSIELSVAAYPAWQAAGFAARESRPVFGRITAAANGVAETNAASLAALHLTSADEDE